ncbi:MAG: WXG100 family type VII secretion target [Mogibacterium sp.]|nr:WXG100 family type VII secretion target [Mogibacterium sp.]
MEGIIKVTPEILMNTASEFRSEGTQIGNLTSEMMDLINGLPSTWVGEAGAAYVSKFNGLRDDIQRMLNMISEHVEDLNTMAQTYMSTEQQITETTQSLSSDVIV